MFQTFDLAALEFIAGYSSADSLLRGPMRDLAYFTGISYVMTHLTYELFRIMQACAMLCEESSCFDALYSSIRMVESYAVLRAQPCSFPIINKMCRHTLLAIPTNL